MVNRWVGGVGMRESEVDQGVQEGVYVSKSSVRGKITQRPKSETFKSN